MGVKVMEATSRVESGSVGSEFVELPIGVQPLVLQGHAIDVLKRLPPQSVQTCVTSPPYWGLRNYRTEPQAWGGDQSPTHVHTWGSEISGDAKGNSGTPTDKNNRGEDYARGDPRGNFCPCGAWKGELGHEPTPELYVAHLADVAEELKRVLRDDGTFWLNIGDSYVGGGRGSGIHKDGSASLSSNQYWEDNQDGKVPLAKAGGVYKAKDLVGIPWMVAFELRRRGWYLRSDIIWAKKNSMPEPFKDRPTKGHEYIFLLTKKPTYFYDRDGFHQPFAESSMSEAAEEYDGEGTKDYEEAGVQNPSDVKRRIVASMRKRMAESRLVDGVNQIINGSSIRTVWHIATKGYKGAHFATFTDEIPMRCIKLGTSEVGACATCGTPYARVTRSEGGGIGQDWHPDKSLGNGRAQGIAATGLNDGTYRRVRLGFQKECSCDTEDIVPCVVLDIFAGSGTTMVVARKLGRRSIGIDLNAQYVEEIQEARPDIGGPSFVDAW